MGLNGIVSNQFPFCRSKNPLETALVGQHELAALTVGVPRVPGNGCEFEFFHMRLTFPESTEVTWKFQAAIFAERENVCWFVCHYGLVSASGIVVEGERANKNSEDCERTRELYDVIMIPIWRNNHLNWKQNDLGGTALLFGVAVAAHCR